MGGDTINFSILYGSTITLTRSFGEIAFNKSLTIDGSGLNIAISGNDPTPSNRNNGDGIRIFNITDATNGVNPPDVTMVGMTLTGADPTIGTEGGAIRSAGMLMLSDMLIHQNGAAFGAGVFVTVRGNGSLERDVLRIEDSRHEQNSAMFDGGAVPADEPAGVVCSPKPDPCVMRVPSALRGKETLDERQEA